MLLDALSIISPFRALALSLLWADGRYQQGQSGVVGSKMEPTTDFG